MEFLGLELPVTHLPELDKTFVPLARFFRVYESGATHPFALAVERENGLVSVYNTALRTEGALDQADRLYVDRLAKFLLWSRGGWKLIACGSAAAAECLRDAYAHGGSRDFDQDFMEGVYERPFTVRAAVTPTARRRRAPPARWGGTWRAAGSAWTRGPAT